MNKSGIPFTVVEQGEGPLVVSGAWIFNDESEWISAGAAFESQKELFFTPWPAPPNGIDWKKSALIVVSVGQLATSPSRVDVLSIVPHGTNVVVEAQFRGSGSQSASSQWIIVKIDRGNIKTVKANIRSA